MKKEFAVLSVSFALLVACGDETTIETVTRAGMDVVASADDLPECTEENEGEYAFVKADEETRICVDGKWKPAATPDAGNGTFSCKTEELKDKSGLKIVCNGDSIGVVLNGVNGAEGKPGENGNDGAPGLNCSIKDHSDMAVVIACGDSTITIDLKVNQPQDTAKVDSEQVSIFRDSIVGYAQKGPFLKGTTVYLYELSDGQSLKPVGAPLTGIVMRDDGYFRFPARSFANQYALVVVEGKYRNEVSGKVSDNPIRLNALVDLGNRDSVNVNVLTHLEYERVHHLVTRENYTVEKAKQKAQQEILKLFHIELDSVMSAENANIFGSTDADAALLAVSMLLQGDSSSLALSALLNEMSNAISETGKLTSARADSVFATLAEWALIMSFDYPYSKFEDFRSSVSKWRVNKTVPDFEKHIRKFFSIESGLGVCGSDSVSVGVVKNVSNRFVKTYYASNYSSYPKERFICKEKEGVKNWHVAGDIEKDTMSFGHEYAEGLVKKGLVNANLSYVFEKGNWRHGTPYDGVVNLGCIPARKDSVAEGSDGNWYKCNADTIMNYCLLKKIYTSPGHMDYVDVGNCRYGIIESEWTSAWRRASNIEMDTATWGHNYNEGDVRNGNVNTTLTYVYQNDNWRRGSDIDSLVGKKGCVSFRQDTVAYAVGKGWFICKNSAWQIAKDIEKDTATWGHDYNEGDVRNGKINTNLTYVYQNGNWRLGTELDSLLVKAGGTACTTDGDTSTVKYNDVYYVCTPQTTGNVVRKWVVAPDIYNDTYEERSECNVDGKYGDGSLLIGHVNTDKVYVCDDGEFRTANDREKKVGRGCTSYNKGYFQKMTESDYAEYGYVCKENGEWNSNVTIQRITSKYGTVTDERDGKTYYTITIGEQTWMAENLNFDYKVNGVTYGTSTDTDNGDVYERRYAWGAVMDSAALFSTNTSGCGYNKMCSPKVPARGICPEGWHVPTSVEWNTLYSTMDKSPYAMQAKGFDAWPDASDTYGLSVLPRGSAAFFWSASEENGIFAGYWRIYKDLAEGWHGYKDSFFSVRCLKDAD